MQKIICMKWGKKYSSIYVNKLYHSIIKFTKKPTKLICFTDDKKGINENILCKPLPNITLPDILKNSPWKKLSIWQYPLFDIQGEVLFLDLDLVITGNLDRFFEYKKNDYCVIENWTQKGSNIGNTSCFKFNIGKHKYIYDDFQKNPIAIFKRYRIEQVYISKTIKSHFFWPDDWCKSFKHNLLPPWPKKIVVSCNIT